MPRNRQREAAGAANGAGRYPCPKTFQKRAHGLRRAKTGGKAMKPKNLPYSVKLPKDAISPTGSIYRDYDIVRQQAVLNTFAPHHSTVYSMKPFALRVLVGKTEKVLVARKRRRV